MSLEQTLERTNELLAQVITILQTGVSAQAELGQPEAKPTRTRKSKAEAETAAPAADAPAVTTAPNNILGTVEGDPVGTRYYLIAKHNSVYRELPGDPAPSIDGAVLIPAAEYVAKKAEFAAMTKAIIEKSQAAAEPTTAPAATPAPATPAASTAPSQPSEPTSDEVPFSKVVEAMTSLSKSDKPGHGREGLLAVLKKYLPGEDRPTVTKMQPLGINAEIVKHVESLLNAVEADFDPLA